MTFVAGLIDGLRRVTQAPGYQRTWLTPELTSGRQFGRPLSFFAFRFR